MLIELIVWTVRTVRTLLTGAAMRCARTRAEPAGCMRARAAPQRGGLRQDVGEELSSCVQYSWVVWVDGPQLRRWRRQQKKRPGKPF